MLLNAVLPLASNSHDWVLFPFRIAMPICHTEAFSFGSLHGRILRPVNPGMDFDSTIFFVLYALKCALYFYHFQYFRIFGKMCILSNMNFTPFYLLIH